MENSSLVFTDDKTQKISGRLSKSKALSGSFQKNLISFTRRINYDYYRFLWKINKLIEYRKYGYFSLTPGFLFKEFSSQRFRTNNYETYLMKNREMIFEETKTKFGIVFTDDTSVGALKEVFMERIYDRLSEFIPSKDDVVVDIGAQCGDFSLLCASYYGVKEVHSFEPLAGNFEKLETNIKLNKADQVIAYNFAVGSTNSIEKIYWDGDMMCKSETNNFENITVKTLDSFKLHPTILKIDVEGFELDVLGGAKETIMGEKPKIILEVHSKLLKAQCISRLKSMGYRLVKSGRKNVNPLSEMNVIQNLYFLPN